MKAEDIVLFVVKHGYTKTSITHVQKALDALKAEAENAKTDEKSKK